MPTPILEIYREKDKRRSFAWRQYYKHKNKKKIVASATGYNRKETVHKVLHKSVFRGWDLDWSSGTAELIVGGWKHTMKLLDSTKK